MKTLPKRLTALGLAKRIDQIMTTMGEVSRLWRIRELIDEVLRGEEE
tara:strand:+ start:1684 stop:1824 length:141 start_codon:yes stop_codon:yes gene_type:complete